MINIISIIGCITIVIVLILILLLKNRMGIKNKVKKAVIIPIKNNIPMAQEVINIIKI